MREASVPNNARNRWDATGIALMRVMSPNDPKLSRGHWRLALDCNLDSQISYLNPKFKGQWRWLQQPC